MTHRKIEIEIPQYDIERIAIDLFNIQKVSSIFQTTFSITTVRIKNTQYQYFIDEMRDTQ
jgi:hypothetical protein